MRNRCGSDYTGEKPKNSTSVPCAYLTRRSSGQLPVAAYLSPLDRVIFELCHTICGTFRSGTNIGLRMSIHNRTLAYASLGTSIFSGGTSREDYLESLEQALPDENSIFPHPLIWMRLASDPYLSPEGHQYTIFEDRGKCVTFWFTGPLAKKSTVMVDVDF